MYNRRLGKPFRITQAHLGGSELGLVEVIVATQHHFIGLRTNGRDEGGMAKSNAQPFTLTYGVVGVSAVTAQHLTLGVDIVALANDSVIICHILSQERTVVVVGNEANLLRLFFLRQSGITMLARNVTNLLFGQVAQRKDSAPEVVLGEHPKEIGLVLAGVGGTSQISMPPELADAGIMAGSHIGTTQFVCNAQHLAPFDMTIAKYARVGSATMHVLVDKIGNDVLTESVAEIHDMVVDAHLLRVVFGLHDAVDGATAFLAGKARFFDTVKRTESDTHHFVTLLLEEHGADGRINTAGHSQ